MSENELSTDSSIASKSVITENVQEAKISSDECFVKTPVKKMQSEVRVELENVKPPTPTQKRVRLSVDEPLTQKEKILNQMSLFDARNQSLSSGEETNSTLDSNEFAVKWAWKGAKELEKKVDKSISLSDDHDDNTESSNSVCGFLFYLKFL